MRLRPTGRSQDPPTVPPRIRGVRGALRLKFESQRARIAQLQAENQHLRATLKIMGGEVGVHNREVETDIGGEKYEYADVVFPILFPAGWRRADNSYTQREIGGVRHAVIRVIKTD